MTPQKLKKELLDLASDVKKAGHIEFYLDHGDRAPDGTRLTESGQKMIAEALEFQANHIALTEPKKETR